MDALTNLVPEVTVNNAGNIAAFSLVMKYVVDGLRVLADKLNLDVTLDPKVIASLVIFAILLITNSDNLGSINDVTTLAGEAVVLAASTYGVHKLIKNN